MLSVCPREGLIRASADQREDEPPGIGGGRRRRRVGGSRHASDAYRIVGVSRKTINTVENHVFVPSTVLAPKLARALECSVHDLFERPEER